MKKCLVSIAVIALTTGTAIQSGFISGLPETKAELNQNLGCSWVQLDTTNPGVEISSGPGEVNDMVIFNGDLIVSGIFSKAGGSTVNSIAKWNGTSWSALGSGGDIGVKSGSSHGTVNNLVVFNDGGGNDLYVGGAFDKAGSVTTDNIARWTGTAWQAVDGGVDAEVSTMTVFKPSSSERRLYVFNAVGFTVTSDQYLALWISNSDSTWNPEVKNPGFLDSHRETPNATIKVSYSWDTDAGDSGPHEQILLGGGFAQINYTNDIGTSTTLDAMCIISWDGNDTFTALACGLFNDENAGTDCTDPTGGEVLTILEYNAMGTIGEELFVGGNFDKAGPATAPITVNNLARWDGTTWGTIANGSNVGTNNVIKALHKSGIFTDTSLYIGGTFTEVFGTTGFGGVAKLTNGLSGWTADSLDGGVPAAGHIFAKAFEHYSSNLHMGGAFEKVSCSSTTIYNSVAEWDP